MPHRNLFTAALVAAALWTMPVVANAETVAGDTAPPATPQAVNAILDQGLHQYYRGDYVAAEGAFMEALATDPAALAARFYLGYTHYRMGEFDKARADFESAYLIDPNFTPAPPRRADD